MLEALRRFKLSYSLYNFFQKKKLSYNLPLYKKYGLKKRYYSSVSSVDFKGLDNPKNILDEFDSRDILPKNPEFNNLDTNTQTELLKWSENGYAILENFYTSEEIDSFNSEVDALVKSKQATWKNNGNKIMFAIHKSPLLHSAGSNKKLISILNLLLGKKVDLFQSINFLKGSQQRSHSDSVHMTTFPYGNLIAVWVALEDITPDCGPLHYYPGSHKLPYTFNEAYDNVGSKYKLGDKHYSAYEDVIEDVIKNNGFQKEVFLPKKGDILIWHANVLHGGEKMTNPDSSRKSMVFHYYTDDAVCFHEITQRPTLK